MEASFSIEYMTEWGESLSLVLGGLRHPMEWSGNGIWKLQLDDCRKEHFSKYGYVVMRDSLVARTEWDSHSFEIPEGCKSVDIRDKWIECPAGCEFPRRHQAEKFDIPGFRGAGTAVPVFSLRSDDDFGIGEFHDLIPLVDWAAATGQCIIQLLPVNDTTRHGGWEDSYPYSPISSFALNPLYIHLQDIGVVEDEVFRKTRQELNALPAIDYPKVFKAKMALVRRAFLLCGADDMAGEEYKEFYKENAFWLEEYARFCAVRDSFGKEYYFWMQFHLDRQFHAVAEYARKKGISLKGDLPIGVSADSADAYWHPELFNLDSRAGAPPDFFSKDGQLWPFPTYNWDAMARDDYSWWKSRLERMSRYFDAFRIDHILGFFRIWEIPAGDSNAVRGHFNPALPLKGEEIDALGLPLDERLFVADPRSKGCFHPRITPDTSLLEPWQKERFDSLYWDFFFRRHNDFWWRNAERKLPSLLSATGMLACGEDLGMVPTCVQDVMNREKILSLEMSMMDKGRPWPRLSVCATSSHDMSTLRMQNAEAGRGDLDAQSAGKILRSHLESQSMLAIFPIQDWLAMDSDLRRADYSCERINDPANPRNHWCYRMHLGAAELLSADAFNEKIREMLSDSRRSSSIWAA